MEHNSWLKFRHALGTCYKLEGGEELVVNSVHESLEMTLLLDAEAAWAIQYSNIHFHVIISHWAQPDEWAYADLELHVMPGLRYEVSLEQLHYSDLAHKSGCIEPGAAGHLQFFPGYFYELCLIECQVKIALEQNPCYCVPLDFSLYSQPDQPTCGFLEDIICKEPTSKAG